MKSFDDWNQKKKHTDKNHARPLFKEREVWWCSVGVNVGDEQDGKGNSFARPVLVLRKFNRNVFVGIPFSTQIKSNPFYHPISFNNREQSLILSQIRLLDAKRFGIKIGELSEEKVSAIKEKIKNLLLL